MKTPTTCLEMSIESPGYLDRLRLGVSPGDTSEVFGQDENSDNLPGDKQREVGKIDRLKLGVGPEDTSEVFGQ